MLVLDAHVHIYDCYDLTALFNSAHENFRAQAMRLGCPDALQGVLLLTERKGQNWFDILAGRAARSTNGKTATAAWRIEQTGEDESLILDKENGAKLFMVAGRQVQSREGLEVLALATAALFEDGQPAADIVRQVRAAGAIPVIPWAFGKWFGKRGRVLQQMVDSGKRQLFYLGDNGGRPWFMPRPDLLRSAGKILSGTDPLPLAGEEQRAGSFGIYANTRLNEETPAADLRSRIDDGSISFYEYGKPLNAARFIRNQFVLRGL